MTRLPPAPTPADIAILDPDGSFQARLADDHARLETASPAERKVIIHRLAGAAGTFGYIELGRLALALDDILADGRSLPDDAVPRLRDTLARAMAKSA